jgi:hypothetical protein
MEAPKRIQRKRTKGWKMPAGAVYVGRPTKWGNPFHVTVAFSEDGAVFDDDFPCGIGVIAMLDEVMDLFKAYAVGRHLSEKEWLTPLRGKDLACWCPLVDKNGKPVPCHADVLLELANMPQPTE